MPASDFGQRLWELDGTVFPPHVSFRGDVRNLDGSPLSTEQVRFLKWIVEPVSSATEQITLPDPSRFKVGQSLVTPRTVIDWSGMPNASARTTGEGELVIHLGMLFFLASLPITLVAIRGLLSGPGVDLGALQRFRPSDAVLAELDRLMDSWDSSAETGWASATLPAIPAGSSPEHQRATPFHREMTYIVVGHELTHWLETIYTDSEWERMVSDVERQLDLWLREDRSIDPATAANISRSLQDPEVRESWVREAHADGGAYDFAYASATYGGWIKGDAALRHLQEVNIHMALFFELLRLYEVWATLRGILSDVITHPPALVRRALFCHLQAVRNRQSQEEFLFRQFGAGTAVGYVMQGIVEKYVTARGYA